MIGRITVAGSLFIAFAGCTPHRAAHSAADARLATANRLTDTLEYRRLCVVPTGSAVDIRQPCVLRDQSPTIRKSR